MRIALKKLVELMVSCGENIGNRDGMLNAAIFAIMDQVENLNIRGQ
jgi:hypothetical protein